MKKFLAIAAIAATFTACNDEKKAEDAPKMDSPSVVTNAAVDTAAAKMQTAVDTAAAKMQTAVDTAAAKMKMEVKKP